MSFRKYGGTQFASSHNVVKSNVNTTGSFYVTENVGQSNTYINFESDISGNIIIYGDLDVSGNVNIDGDVDINGNLYVQQNIDCSGNVNIDGTVNATSYNSASDYRIKKDVFPLDDKFTVDKLRPVTYNNTKLEKQDIGLIAHEVQEIYPFLVNGEKDGENFQSVNYTGLIGILIKEIQELKERVKKLENPSS